jgi:lysophospholipase L1-like esterase
MTLRLAVLGDSIAYGTGASRTGDTLAPRLVAELAAAGIPAEGRLFAVPGAQSADLDAQVARARAWRPQVALVVIGANDLTRLVPPATAAARLQSALRGLRALGAAIVVAPAPDLSVLPQVPPALRQVVRAGSALLRQAQTRVTLTEGGRVADVAGTTSRAFAADPALLSSDRYHPSSAGYAVIAGAVSPEVVAAAREVVSSGG